jgi:hypothetical protein
MAKGGRKLEEERTNASNVSNAKIIMEGKNIRQKAVTPNKMKVWKNVIQLREEGTLGTRSLREE